MTENLKEIAQRMGIVAAVAGLLAAGPGTLLARSQGPQTQSDAKRSATTDEMKQAQLEKEEEAQEREEEIRDREQEKKDQEQERAERLQELYDDGREALDDGQYGVAGKKFAELYQLKGPQSDAALYWLAYAENKQGKREAALARIADLKKSYPQSRWTKDATALEMEVRQNSGQKTNPDAVSDEDLKLLALQGIMNNNSEQGVALVEKVLNSSSSPAVKSKALFVLAQSGSPASAGSVGEGCAGARQSRIATEGSGIPGNLWGEARGTNAGGSVHEYE